VSTRKTTKTWNQRTLPDLPSHLLTGAELSPNALTSLLDRAAELKRRPLDATPLRGRSVALIFEEPSTRTRVSFEAGIVELGGHPMVLHSADLQLSRGESLRDTAYVLSRHAAAICIRTVPHATAAELAEHASVPVINVLTARHHPCQALADALTLREEFGSLQGLKLAYVGDGNNVARSLATMAPLAGVEVRIASPPEYALEDPPPGAVLTEDPREAAKGADAVYTDVWVSMGQEAEAEERKRSLAPYRVDGASLARTRPDTILLHCLPAKRGEEITDDVLDGPQSAVWDQAENRLHTQKALLAWLFGHR